MRVGREEEKVEIEVEVWGREKTKIDLATDNPGESRDLNSHEVPQTISEICFYALGEKRRNPGDGCELGGGRERECEGEGIVETWKRRKV